MRVRNKGIRNASLLLAGLIFLPRSADAEVWQLARGPSSVEFAIGHLVFTEVTGRFGRFEGSVNCPGDDFTDAKVEATIDVKSIYTGHRDRDQELLSEAFFEADRFPEIRFESRSIERTGPETYRLIGDLTIHGITHSVEFETFYGGERKAKDSRRRDFRATASVNRSDFGITWNDTWAGRALVAEEVEITLAVALVAASG